MNTPTRGLSRPLLLTVGVGLTPTAQPWGRRQRGGAGGGPTCSEPEAETYTELDNPGIPGGESVLREGEHHTPGSR